MEWQIQNSSNKQMAVAEQQDQELNGDGRMAVTKIDCALISIDLQLFLIILVHSS